MPVRVPHSVAQRMSVHAPTTTASPSGVLVSQAAVEVSNPIAAASISVTHGPIGVVVHVVRSDPQ